MATEKQIAAARANGAKSRGPTTPAGKEIVSANALKHGLTAAKFTVLPQERPAFEALHEMYFSHYAPRTPMEAFLTEKCVTTMWLLSKAEPIQYALLDLEVAKATPTILSTCPVIDAAGAQAIAFRTLNDRSTSFVNLDRHQARLLRQFTHFTNLLEAERAKPIPPPEEQNKPPEEQPEPPEPLTPNVGQASACEGLQPDCH